MAGSRRTSDSNEGGRTRLKASFVLLIGLSGGLIAVQGDASPAIVGLATVGGLVVGGALLWYLSWSMS